MSCWKDELNGDNQSLRDTWIKDLAAYPNVDYRFFHGSGDSQYPGQAYRFSRGELKQLPSDIVILDSPDEYQSLILKSQEFHYWGYRKVYDFVFKADSDTYVDVPSLMESGFEKHDYFGHIHTWPGSLRDEGVNKYGFLGGGEGYWTSRRACEIISKAKPKKGPAENFGSAEDLWTGEVLGEEGIKMVDHVGYGSGITLHGSLIAGERGAYSNRWMYTTYEERKPK